MNRNETIKDIIRVMNKASEYCYHTKCSDCAYHETSCIDAYLAELLYDMGYRKTSVYMTEDNRAYKEGYTQGRKEVYYEIEIETLELKRENEKLKKELEDCKKSFRGIVDKLINDLRDYE